MIVDVKLVHLFHYSTYQMATAKFKSVSPYTRTAVPSQIYTSDTTPAPLTVALVGLGRIGVMYLANIRANAQLKLSYVVLSVRQDPSQVRAQHRIPDHVIVTCDPQVAFTDACVEAVIIASSTESHVPLILSALSAKKAVYCEKPIADTLEKTGQCYAAAAQAGLPLFCAFNRRFDPSYSHIQAQVRAGAVGHVQTIKSVSRDSPIIPLSYIGPSGGIFDDFSVHDIDLLLWVTGDVPVQVFVSGNSQIPEFLDHNDFDNMIILLNFKHGTLGTIDLNRYSSYGYDQRLEVFGPLGMLHCENSRPDHVVVSDRSGSAKKPLHYSFPSHYDQAFKNQLNYFVDLVRGQVELSVTEKMTRAVSKVVQACKESVTTGLPVKIAWSEHEIPDY